MKKFYLLALFMALAITVAACTPQQQQQAADTLTNNNEDQAMMEDDDSMMEDDSAMMEDSQVVINLEEQNNSNQSGTVTLTREGDGTRVVFNVTNAPGGVQQPAHIHFNSCANIGGVKYPLNALVNGQSTTLLQVPLSDLTSIEQLSVNVHKSVDEISTYVACGDLPFELNDNSMMEDESMNDDSMMEDDDSMMEDDSAMMEDDDSMMEDDSAMMEEVKTFEVGGTNFEFDVKEIRVNEGDRVRITFTSNEGFHDWVVDEFEAATSRVQAGQTATVEFVANKTGTFEYYCSVGSHRQQGMVGQLIVQ